MFSLWTLVDGIIYRILLRLYIASKVMADRSKSTLTFRFDQRKRLWLTSEISNQYLCIPVIQQANNMQQTDILRLRRQNIL